MKKRFITAVISLVLFSLVACGNAETANAPASEAKEDTYADITTSRFGLYDVPESEQLDLFADINVIWGGVHPDGTITIDKDACSQEIRKYVMYSPDMFSDIHNGDTIKVLAVYHNEDEMKRYTQEKEYIAVIPLYDRNKLGNSLQSSNANAKLVCQNSQTAITKIQIAEIWDESFSGYYTGDLTTKGKEFPEIPENGFASKDDFGEFLTLALQYYQGSTNGGVYVIKLDSEGNPELTYWSSDTETITVGGYPTQLTVDDVLESEKKIADYIE